ncbi:hypothetical protein QJS10_CPA07g00620 [Acorus calamus]|uniref:Uncharacterized protein n=1 Tax=Acorus calamus TaxID=4465 RepID=A0AAV9EJ36_ACOCL|nr:hypothetical protein QJS10_CPA07g00620 [Acorus calamus]
MGVPHNMARELGVPHLGEPFMEHRWVAVLSFGEGWHNNHHAFEYSARHGLEWWQIDITWYVVWLLQAVGLATDVKLPSPIQRQMMCSAVNAMGLPLNPSKGGQLL